MTCEVIIFGNTQVGFDISLVQALFAIYHYSNAQLRTQNNILDILHENSFIYFHEMNHIKIN